MAFFKTSIIHAMILLHLPKIANLIVNERENRFEFSSYGFYSRKFRLLHSS